MFETFSAAKVVDTVYKLIRQFKTSNGTLDDTEGTLRELEYLERRREEGSIDETKYLQKLGSEVHTFLKDMLKIHKVEGWHEGQSRELSNLVRLFLTTKEDLRYSDRR
jgi:hypothetical protein